MNTNRQESLYDYDDFVTFLSNYMQRRRMTDPWFSSRWLSRRAGLKSPTQLSMLLNRRRPPTLELVTKICHAICFTEAELRYAILMTEKSLNRSPVLVEMVQKAMGDLRQGVFSQNGVTQQRIEDRRKGTSPTNRPHSRFVYVQSPR